MGKKTVFFDIDGTLTDLSGIVPASAAAAIHRAQQNGVLCVINTGRPYSHIAQTVKAVGFDGYVCSCGQHIVCGGETVFRHHADRAYSQYIAAAAKRYRLDLLGEAEEAVWGIFCHAPGGTMLTELELFKQRGLRVFASASEGDMFFDKFCVWRFPDSDAAGFAAAVSDRFTSTGAEGQLLEFVLNGYSKQTGGEAFLSLVGAKKEDTYAIGDSVNDLPMFRTAAHTAAMQNSARRLMEEAEYVTAGVYTDGVAQALAHFGLL